MPVLLRPVLTAFGLACLLSAASLQLSGAAFAQAKQQPAPGQQAAPAEQRAPALKQIALTDKQLDGVLAAQKDMDAITEKLPENTAPDQKVADSDEAGHAFQFEAGRAFRSEAGHPWRRSHGSIS